MSAAPAADTVTPLPASWLHIHKTATDSTMQDARARLANGQPSAPFYCTADTQQYGYGRRGAPWQSASGNLHATYALPCPFSPQTAVLGGVLAASATLETLHSLIKEPHLLSGKWPNDIYAPTGKLAGVLAEVLHRQDGERWLLLGIGVNITSAPPLASETAYPSACLQELLLEGDTPDASGLAAAIAASLSQTIERTRRCGQTALLARWCAQVTSAIPQQDIAALVS